jgi:anti-sigma B factor antagonist
MRVVEEEVGKGVSILLFGPLRAPVGGAARQEVEEALGRGARSVVLDLAHVSDIDAAGLGELVGLYTSVLAEGRLLRVVNPNSRVGLLLDVAGLRGVLCGLSLPPRRDGCCAGLGLASRAFGYSA